MATVCHVCKSVDAFDPDHPYICWPDSKLALCDSCVVDAFRVVDRARIVQANKTTPLKRRNSLHAKPL